jgi:Uma2 family endonuclease
MELMSPRKEHEKIKTLLGRFVAAFAELRGMEIESAASTTFRRQDLDRGFEADESFYIEHADAVRAKEEIDLTIDPPPDLVIEVDMTSSAIRKLDLFAAMGVPEVWRYDGQQLRLFHLQATGYEEVKSSTVLPGFPVTAAQSVLSARHDRGEIALLKEFRSKIDKQ